jgi:hypothetical protein
MFTQANDIREVRQAMRTLCAAIGQPAPFAGTAADGTKTVADVKADFNGRVRR